METANGCFCFQLNHVEPTPWILFAAGWIVPVPVLLKKNNIRYFLSLSRLLLCSLKIYRVASERLSAFSKFSPPACISSQGLNFSLDASRRIRRNQMGITRASAARWMLIGTLTTFFTCWTSSPAQGQEGDNAVFGTSAVTSSTAYIDASAFPTGTGGHTDICSIINSIYVNNLIPSGGGVIDARGVALSGSNPCTISPWSGLTSLPPPSTVLLPAGVIVINVQWVIPNGSRIIGDRRDTQIAEDFASTPTDPFMILMGNSTFCPSGCEGIVIQDVTLTQWTTASVLGIGGIDNEYAGQFSYVDHVVVNGMGTGVGVDGVGLKIGSGAANSGPYTNVNYTAGANCTSGAASVSCATAVCVQIQASTRGIHGMTCTASSTATDTTPPPAAVELDADNNSIEDVHFEGFYDGVVVGDSAGAAGNVLINLTGGYGLGPVTNEVHICNGAAVSMSACTTSGSAADLTILGLGIGGGGGSAFNAYAIRDDVTGTIVDESSNASEGTVGIYALGESDSGGHSRFTTGPFTSGATTSQPSPNPSPVWGTGSSAPTGSCPTGAIFSHTAGSTSTTLYVCVSSAWTAITL
jgi:hypothetical protein